jgi:hypothetical protein
MTRGVPAAHLPRVVCSLKETKVTVVPLLFFQMNVPVSVPDFEP